jgi:hypothetical protein
MYKVIRVEMLEGESDKPVRMIKQRRRTFQEGFLYVIAMPPTCFDTLKT